MYICAQAHVHVLCNIFQKQNIINYKFTVKMLLKFVFIKSLIGSLYNDNDDLSLWLLYSVIH